MFDTVKVNVEDLTKEDREKFFANWRFRAEDMYLIDGKALQDVRGVITSWTSILDCWMNVGPQIGSKDGMMKPWTELSEEGRMRWRNTYQFACIAKEKVLGILYPTSFPESRPTGSGKVFVGKAEDVKADDLHATLMSEVADLKAALKAKDEEIERLQKELEAKEDGAEDSAESDGEEVVKLHPAPVAPLTKEQFQDFCAKLGNSIAADFFRMETHVLKDNDDILRKLHKRFSEMGEKGEGFCRSLAPLLEINEKTLEYAGEFMEESEKLEKLEKPDAEKGEGFLSDAERELADKGDFDPKDGRTCVSPANGND